MNNLATFLKLSLSVLVACLFSNHALADKSLSFLQAVDLIIERNTDLSIRKSQLRGVEYGNIGSRTALLPSVSIAYTENTTKFDSVSGKSNSQRMGLDANWNLFRFGADASAWKADISEEKKFESLVEDSHLSAQKAAVSAIANYIGQSSQVDVANKIYKLNLDSHKIVKARFNKGLLSQQEVDKVFIDVQNAKARWQDARISLGNTRANLMALLGHTNIRLQWPWMERFSRKNQKDQSITTGFAIQNIPSWNAAQSDLDSNNHSVSSNFRKFFPSVDVNGAYNFGGTNSTTTEYFASLTISLPIFDRLSRYSTYKAQVESRTQAELNLEATRRNVDSEWTAAKNEFEISRTTAIAREEALSIARRIYRANERRFRGGRISANDLSLDQERLFRAEQNAVVGWTSLHIAITRLCHAKGLRLRQCLPGIQ